MPINDQTTAVAGYKANDASQSFADELFGAGAMKDFRQKARLDGGKPAPDDGPVPVSLGGQNTGGERIFYLVNTGAGTSELQYSAKKDESLLQIAQDVLLAQGVAVEGSFDTLTLTQQVAIENEANAIAKFNNVSVDSFNLSSDVLLKIPPATDKLGAQNMQRTLLAADIANQQLLGKEGSWRQATDLADLGTLDFATGDSAAAQKHLAQAVEMMQDGIKDGTIKETDSVDQALIETLTNYGTSLAVPGKDLHQSNGEVLEDRLNADKAYQEALDLATRTGQSPYAQASILDKLGTNETVIAQELLQLKGQAAFNEYMQKADDHYEQAMDLLPIDQSSTPEEIAAKAIITADRAFEKAHHAKKPHDQFAEDAAKYFQDAWDLWNQYEPSKAAGMDTQTAQNYRDFYLASDLSNYDELLTSEIGAETDGSQKTQDSRELARVEKTLNPLIENHPEWQPIN